MKNNSPEVGLFQRLFIALQCPLHMGVHGYGIVQDRQDFRIVIMIMLQHFIDILLHLSNFLSIFPHVVTHDPQSFRQISFFRLTAYISLHTVLQRSFLLLLFPLAVPLLYPFVRAITTKRHCFAGCQANFFFCIQNRTSCSAGRPVVHDNRMLAERAFYCFCSYCCLTAPLSRCSVPSEHCRSVRSARCFCDPAAACRRKPRNRLLPA